MERAERPPLGKRIGYFVTLMGIVCVITTTVIVTQRLSNDALAILVGLGAGVAVMTPSVLILFMVWRRQELRRDERRLSAEPAHTMPQVVVVAPPAMPGYSGGYGPAPYPALEKESAPGWAPASSERKFTIVGGES
ncbi:MAG: hypothetical protein ACLFU8_12945 [Anaerolineales bacterium]